MNFEKLRVDIAKILAPEVFEEGSKWKKIAEEGLKLNKELIATLEGIKDKNDLLLAAGLQLKEEVDNLKEAYAPNDTRTELEKYCDTNFKKVPMVAYEGKRDFQDKPISVYLNQMITPESFEVKKFAKDIKVGSTLRESAVHIGNKVSKEFTWTSDKNLSTSGDFYLYPEEIIVTSKGDCEDHSFTVSSINTGIGVAYGFKGKGGHAFNCFVENGKVYILETTGSIGKVEEYETQEDYKIYFIITKNKMYQLKSGVTFGKIAGWS